MNRDAGEWLQDEIAGHFIKLRKAGRLEQRQVEQWLLLLKKRLFRELEYDLGEDDKQEQCRWLRP